MVTISVRSLVQSKFVTLAVRNPVAHGTVHSVATHSV